MARRGVEVILERTALDSSELRWNCESIQKSKKPPKTSVLLGQERAVRALRTGLELYAPGFNIFVSGLLGSGRLRIVRNLLEELKPACRLGPDRVFVHNYREPNKPRLVDLPRGSAARFRTEMLELGRAARDTLRQSLHSRWHRASRQLVVREAEDRRARLFDALEREAKRQGCSLVQYRDGGDVSADVLPVVDGEVQQLERLRELVGQGRITDAQHERLVRAREELIERLEQATERVRRVYRETQRELQQIDREMAARCLRGLFEEFTRSWQIDAVGVQLEQLRERILASLEDWVGEADEQRSADEGEGRDLEITSGLPAHLAAELEVHVVKSDHGVDCPVVVEGNPTYPNLFGTIEPAQTGGSIDTPLGRIHPGALLRADGGYLILRASDLLSEPGAWHHLLRALKTGAIEIREFDPSSGTTAGALQPEAIPIDVKVVLIGEPGLYEHLCEQEPPFRQQFKVHAEFDATVPNNISNRRRYADFLDWISADEGLGKFLPQAIAAIVELGARESGRRTRLSTRFGELADVAREAAYVAQRRSSNGRAVAREDVEAALAARDERASLLREAVERDFSEGYVVVKTSGSAVGTVNAPTIVETESVVFGKPVRVTATTSRASPGRSGVFSIEREAELSGPLHDKGVLILSGFLMDRFGRDRDLAMRATVCFEQLYTGLDGDSASCAELIALLSSLAALPIDQGLAITGSMNQRGDVQAIGGVNEKIESWFGLCRSRRLTGKQGVVIPRVNVDDLMLKHEVVEAVSLGRFAVYAIDTIDEAVALLFGTAAAEVYAAVAETLDAFAVRE